MNELEVADHIQRFKRTDVAQGIPMVGLCNPLNDSGDAKRVNSF